MYAWGLYNKTLIAYQNYPQAGDVSDMLFDSNDARGIAWANNRMSASNVSADTWTFEFIRRVNLMLDNIENSQMTEKEKAHWRGVGYFSVLMNTSNFFRSSATCPGWNIW